MHDFPVNHCAAVTLRFYGQDGGYPGGDFVNALLEAFSRADATNFRGLAAGFPTLAAAVALYKNTDNWRTVLTALVDAPEDTALEEMANWMDDTDWRIVCNRIGHDPMTRWARREA
jgi:hypothetical protein